MLSGVDNRALFDSIFRHKKFRAVIIRSETEFHDSKQTASGQFARPKAPCQRQQVREAAENVSGKTGDKGRPELQQ